MISQFKSFKTLYDLHISLAVCLSQASANVNVPENVVEGEKNEDWVRVVVGHRLRDEWRDQVGSGESQPVHDVGNQ